MGIVDGVTPPATPSDARITAARTANMERASFTSTRISTPSPQAADQTENNG